MLQQRVKWPCLGFSVPQLTTGYDVQLAGEDDQYAYIRVLPKKSKGWWMARQEMQISLTKTAFQVCQMRYVESNSGAFTLDFTETKLNLNPPITLEAITADLPQDWEKHTFHKGIFFGDFAEKPKRPAATPISIRPGFGQAPPSSIRNDS